MSTIIYSALQGRSGVKGRENGERGFTAIELMVVVAIIAVLSALAAPSFSLIIERWRVRQISEALQSTLFLARSEAIKRGGNVWVQKKPQNDNGCTNANGDEYWGCGWNVYLDADGNGSKDIDEKKEPQLHDIALSKDVQVSINPAGSGIRFDRYGMTLDDSGANVNRTYAFVVYPANKGAASPSSIAVCFVPGGRIKTVTSHTGAPQCD